MDGNGRAKQWAQYTNYAQRAFQDPTYSGGPLAQRFIFTGLLGFGGCGVVVRATRRSNGEVVAIKLLKEQDVRSSHLQDLLRREGLTMRLLNYPGTVQLLEMPSEDGIPYLVMERLKGGGRTLLNRRLGGIPIPEAVRLMHCFLNIVECVHGAGYAHLDIKPENFFQDDNVGKCFKLGDFLCSTSVGALINSHGGGTKEYMPPERLARTGIGVLDQRWDLFALGITFAEMIYGRYLGPHDTQSQPFIGDLVYIQGGLGHWLSRMFCGNKELRKVARFLERALHPHPAERFQSVGEMRDELTRAFPSGPRLPRVP